MKILLVEDDAFLAELLTRTLKEQAYVVETAVDGRVGWDLAEAFQYDLILLDVILPGLSGIQFCQKLRARQDSTPVILLTSQDSATHKVSGLDAGADDYLVKPFNVDELLARIRALLRRENSERSPVLFWKELQLNTNNCAVTYNGQFLSLTNKEFKLLELFLRNQQRIFSQSALINHLWALEEAPSENGVRAHIKALRRKLKQAGCEDLIETIYGLGYRLKAYRQDESEQPQSQIADLFAHNDMRQSELPIPPELAEAWEQYRGQYRDRVMVMKQALTALSNGSLNESLRQQAWREAHTLAGSLGSFDLNELSQSCRLIETALAEVAVAGALSSAEIAGLLERLAAIENTLNIQRNVPASFSRLVPVQQYWLLMVATDSSFMWQHYDLLNQTWQTTVLCPADAIATVAQSRPDVVLLDLSAADMTTEGFGVLAALANVQPAVPVVVLTGQDDFEDRIKIARLGGRTVLQTPIAPQSILNAIAQALRHTTQPEGKILIVDDDPIILDQLSDILQPWGFEVELLNHPQTFWQVLEQTKPDLVILDMVMPELSGLDLCQVVRNDPRWESLPVLFLSVHIDADLIYQVFKAGADDYIRKPIIEPELVARIMNQLKRVKPRS